MRPRNGYGKPSASSDARINAGIRLEMKTTDISSRYTLPQYYIPESLQKRGLRLFIFSNTCLETAKASVDSIIASAETIETVKIYTETGVQSDLIKQLQTYCQERIDLDAEAIKVSKTLTLWQLTSIVLHFKSISTYHEALHN